MKRLYHASPRRFSPGQVIGPEVFCSDRDVPHHTVAHRAFDEGWYVYEVVPLSGVKRGADWDELVTEYARVLRRVGNARGLLNRFHRRRRWRGGKAVGSGARPKAG